MTDVVVVGGGVIGLSIAYELAGEGADVTVLEQGRRFGREASWAGAGILPPVDPDGAADPRMLLKGHSHRMWPELSRRLRDLTGVDNGFSRCGGIAMHMPGDEAELDEQLAFFQNHRIACQRLEREQLLELEPSLTPRMIGGCFLPEMGQVRNPRHLKALAAACGAVGVTLLPGQPVVRFDRVNGKIVAAQTPTESFQAGQFCVAGGPWSKPLLDDAGCQTGIEPVRGQMVLLNVHPLPFRRILEYGARYLVPRPDGRILIGSNEEWVGFDKSNTAGAIAELIRFGASLVPSLADAPYERAWAGLRPGSRDGLPYLGQVPGTENLYVAAGHFRSGLQESPATAVLLRQLMLGQELLMPVDDFACDRSRVTAES